METLKTVGIRCHMCKEIIYIETTVEALKRWQSGMKVQDAFPGMPAGEREMFTGSQTCGTCYDKLFPPEEENENDESFPEEGNNPPFTDAETEAIIADFAEHFPTSVTKNKSFEIMTINVGNHVYCDSCNKEYTAEDGIKGGLLFRRNAICPDCEPHMRMGASAFKEERFITEPNMNETFYNFVIRMR